MSFLIGAVIGFVGVRLLLRWLERRHDKRMQPIRRKRAEEYTGQLMRHIDQYVEMSNAISRARRQEPKP